MDLNKEIQVITDKVILEKAPEMIEKHIESMINSVVKDVFNSYSDTSKELKKRIEETLQVNLQKFDLIDYNALVAKTINENLLKQVNLEPILQLTQNIVGFVNKKEIRLDEIAEMFIEASKDENDRDGEGEITFITEENDDSTYISVYADIEPKKEKRNCTIQFCFSIRDSNPGSIFHFKTKDFFYDSKPKEISPSRLVNNSSIEAKIFRLYSAQVKVVEYDNEPSIYWDRY